MDLWDLQDLTCCSGWESLVHSSWDPALDHTLVQECSIPSCLSCKDCHYQEWINNHVNFQCRQSHLKGNVQNYRSWGHKGRVVGELPQGRRGVQGRLHGMRGTRGSPGPAGCPGLYIKQPVRGGKEATTISWFIFHLSKVAQFQEIQPPPSLQ